MMMDHDMDDGIPMDHMNGLPEIDTNIPYSQASSQIPDSQFTQAEGEISQHYEGAPQEVYIAHTNHFYCFQTNRTIKN